MGASVSISRNVEFHSQLDSLFVNKEIRDAEVLFKEDPFARRSFVLFIKSKAWSDHQHGSDQNRHEEAASSAQGSTWNKFGYRDPFRAANEMYSTKSISGSTSEDMSERSISWNDAINDDVYRTAALPVIREPKSCTLCSKKDLRAVLCVAILPLYLGSHYHQAWKEFSEQSSASSSLQGSEKASTFVNPRLRELLLNAASQFDHAELDKFLANPERCWVEVFKQVMVKMPVVLMVSKVHRASKDSKIVFANRLPADRPFSDIQPGQSQVRTWHSTVGQDMHKLYSEDCPRSKSRLLEAAIFRGHLYKMSVTDGLATKLRALVPVYNSRGVYTYAVALETPFFENPAQLQELGMYEQSEKQFHQIEDLLALLPLLIKC